jgi:hypothetical protein
MPQIQKPLVAMSQPFSKPNFGISEGPILYCLEFGKLHPTLHGESASTQRAWNMPDKSHPAAVIHVNLKFAPQVQALLGRSIHYDVAGKAQSSTVCPAAILSHHTKNIQCLFRDFRFRLHCKPLHGHPIRSRCCCKSPSLSIRPA